MVKYGGVPEDAGPGDDHDQPGPRAGPRRPPRLDRGGQGRRHRPLQRPPVRRLRPLRAGPDRRRGLVPAQDGRRQARKPSAGRPRRDPPSPPAAASQGARPAPQPPTGVYASRARRSTRSPAPTSPDGTIVIADGKIAAIGDAETADPGRRRRSIDAKGLDVWPGLIDAGIAARPLRDRQPPRDAGLVRLGRSSSPNCGPSTALHPDSELIPVDPGQRRARHLRPADRRRDLRARAA